MISLRDTSIRECSGFKGSKNYKLTSLLLALLCICFLVSSVQAKYGGGKGCAEPVERG